MTETRRKERRKLSLLSQSLLPSSNLIQPLHMDTQEGSRCDHAEERGKEAAERAKTDGRNLEREGIEPVVRRSFAVVVSRLLSSSRKTISLLFTNTPCPCEPSSPLLKTTGA